MNVGKVDRKKRNFLTAITTALGGVGLVAGSIPFVRSMSPSARARAFGGPVRISVGNITDGQQATVAWRGKPVWVLHRTPDILHSLSSDALIRRLADPRSNVSTQQPAYARNPYRSLKPDYLVVVGICTHLGCVPTFRPDVAPADLGPDWPGGYFCPCHGSKFDFAGRVYKNVPAPTNLVIPPHRYVTDTLVEIGVDSVSKKG